MQCVECENRDAFDLIEIYDSPDTFFFFDPPYHEATRCKAMYLHDDIDHPRFLKRLQTLKGKAMVCGYPHGLYDTQLHGWKKVSFPTSKSWAGGKQLRTETVWLNYSHNGQQIKQNLGVITAFEQLPL